MRVTLSSVSLVLAVVFAGAASAVEETGHGAMEVLTPLPASVRAVTADGTVVSRDACRPRVVEEGLVLPCRPPEDAELVVERPGFERRTVPIREVPSGTVDLNDRGWVPTRVAIRPLPAGLAAEAVLVWIEEDRVLTERVHDGVMLGPRVPPGEPLVLGIVGGVRPVLIEQTRDPSGEPLAVVLEPGRSAAIVCREPWGPAFATSAEVESVNFFPSRALGRSMMAVLATAKGEGGLNLLELPEKTSAVHVSAAGAGPMLRPVDTVLPVTELDLPWPEDLNVEVSSADGEEPVRAKLWVVQPEGGQKWVIAAGTSDASGRAELTLARGWYEVLAESPGFKPARRRIRVPLEGGRRVLEMGLKPARMVRGRVVDRSGTPVAGAAVMAIPQGAVPRSLENVAIAGGDGSFTVTLPDVREVQLVVRASGFATARVPLPEDLPEELEVTLERTCAVTLQAMGSDGQPVSVPVLGLLRDGAANVYMAPARSPGLYTADLAPGIWTVVAEEPGLVGRLEVPDVCDGLTLSVVLTPPSRP